MEKTVAYFLFCAVLGTVVAVNRQGYSFAFIALDALTVSGGLLAAVSVLLRFLASDCADGMAYALWLRIAAVFPLKCPPTYERFKGERKERRKETGMDGVWFGGVLFAVGTCFLPFFL
jgi:hypothetical protein